MFEISSCSQCGKAVTPDNKNDFMEMNGRIFCRDCVNKSTPITTSLSAFQSLRSTQIIKKLSDGKYKNAHTIAEKIDVFEKSLHKSVFKSLFKFVFILAVLGGIGYGGFFLYQEKFKGGDGTENPVKDPVKNGGTPVTTNGSEKDPNDTPKDPKDPDNTKPDKPDKPDDGKAALDAEALAELNKIKEEFNNTFDFIKARKDLVVAMKRYDHKDYKTFLAEIDTKIAASAAAELQEAYRKMDNLIAGKKYSEARKIPEEFKTAFLGTAWIESSNGKKALASLNAKVNGVWKKETETLLKKAEDFEAGEQYLDAYSIYKKIMLNPFPGLKAETDKRMKALITKTAEFYGEKGIEEHLKWARYVKFRSVFLGYIKNREFDEARNFADKAAQDDFYTVVKETIVLDKEDVNHIENVLEIVTSNLKAYTGKDYSLKTEAGKVKGILKEVSKGMVTIETFGVPVSISISKLTSEEFNKILADSTADKGTINIGLGILFLADGKTEQAKSRFNMAKQSGKDITRYLEHIRALEERQKEKKAVGAFRKFKFLLVKKKMG